MEQLMTQMFCKVTRHESFFLENPTEALMELMTN